MHYGMNDFCAYGIIFGYVYIDDHMEKSSKTLIVREFCHMVLFLDMHNDDHMKKSPMTLIVCEFCHMQFISFLPFVKRC